VTNVLHYFLEFKWLVIQSSLEDLELISQIIWMLYAGVLAFIDILSYETKVSQQQQQQQAFFPNQVGVARDETRKK